MARAMTHFIVVTLKDKILPVLLRIMVKKSSLIDME
jgi:hypothetical protein